MAGKSGGAPRALTGAAAAAAKVKAIEGRLAVLAAGLVDRGHATADEEFDPVALALAKLDDLAGEIGQAQRKLRAQKAATARAKKAASSAEAEAPAEPRAIGPIDKPLASHELLELIDDAEKVEVAFSDGTREIAALKPREIFGGRAAFNIVSRGLVLTVADLVVDGPPAGQEAFELAGYGLYLDGELAAYGARTEPLRIGAGVQYSLKGDAVF